MSVLVDTSVWVDHLRATDAHLSLLLEHGRVLCHPFVIGELACGNLKNRAEILAALSELPAAATIDFDEFMHFVDQNRLHGVGLGFVDINLLAAALLSDATLWTADKRLKKIAAEFGATYQENG
jgi:predicted nucleic acid-binding protein